jgi:hypothetical protein
MYIKIKRIFKNQDNYPYLKTAIIQALIKKIKLQVH